MADSYSPDVAAAFATIAGGWFTMGTELGLPDERPPHRVFVDPFDLDVAAVDQIALNGIRVSFLPLDRKRIFDAEFRREMDALRKSHLGEPLPTV